MCGEAHVSWRPGNPRPTRVSAGPSSIQCARLSRQGSNVVKLSTADKLSLYTSAASNVLGVARDPPAVMWVLTQRCFYKCVHCDSWLDERPIDPDALLEIAAKIARAQTKFVALSGGEPLMVKSLPEIVSTLKNAGKLVSINTNGHLLEEAVDWITACEVDHIQVSIDGHDAATHDTIRAREGSFERILRGVEALQAKRANGSPKISICGAVMKENVAHLADFVDRFADVADAVEIQPLHESPGLLATSSAASFESSDRELVREQLDTVMSRHPSFADSYHRNFERFLFDAESMQHKATDHCFPRIYNTLTIREDGACFICRYPLQANIYTSELSDVWRSAARSALYKKLATDGCQDPCWLRCYIHPSPLPGKFMKAASRWGT